MSRIHPSSIISPEAQVHETAEIGPFCLIGPNVKIGANCKMRSHVIIEGQVEIGEGNEFFQFVSIGTAPQDMTYKNEPTKVIVGDHNIFSRVCLGSPRNLKRRRTNDSRLKLSFYGLCPFWP